MIEITKFLQRKERIRVENTHFINSPGLPRWLNCKESACNAGDTGLIPGSGRSPGGGRDNPLQYSCLENPMRSLVGYGPWGCKELNTAEAT